jgi:hypothetical protein
MRHNEKKTRTVSSSACFALVPVLVLMLICFSFTACGNGEKEEAKQDEPAPVSTPVVKVTDNPIPAPAAGWKTFNLKSYSVAIPEDWASDLDTQVFSPKSDKPAMGLPPVSVHVGGMPLMPGTSFEARLKSYMNSEPTLKESVNAGGFAGLKCVWENMGKKHLGIFLEEKVGGGVGVIHFADCRAPVNEFDTHKAAFEKIVNSFRYKK